MSEDGFDLSDARIAIVGLGLMGGSLALALKGACREIVGIDIHSPSWTYALESGIVDRASSDPGKLLPEADAIILATPVPAILSVLNDLPEIVRDSCVLMDLGSTKMTIVQAMRGLPGRFDPIGGHPICGKELLSLFNADPAIYKNAAFVLTKLERTTPRAVSFALQMVRAVGSRPLWVEAEDHDVWLAASSHLPFLLSSALVLATPDEAVPMTGPGFLSTSRLASTPGSMMVGILQTNRSNILKSLNCFREKLDILEKAMQEDDEARLRKLILESNTRHTEFINSR
ncbi:MAG: prephenate dehydrogenase/arogenate dehydrogenase family protein [Anaerolineales bacterium]|nr:prephenate dehydrogenase/arogenate dehydrogenase family protein [Anaerolineales bacterium]